MAELNGRAVDDAFPVLPLETALLSTNSRTRHVDRCVRLLADRRRRFCLYYLHRAPAPLSRADLAVLVEGAVTPSGSVVTERLFEKAVRRLVDVHLPKLRDAGLVRVDDGYVELVADPAIPVRDWLTTTAAVELDADGTEGQHREGTSTDAGTGDDPTRDEERIAYTSLTFDSSP